MGGLQGSWHYHRCMVRRRTVISACETGSVGFSIQPMMPGGAPAATAASSTIFAAAIVHFAARGCGDSTSALRVFRHSSAYTGQVWEVFLDRVLLTHKTHTWAEEVTADCGNP